MLKCAGTLVDVVIADISCKCNASFDLDDCGESDTVCELFIDTANENALSNNDKCDGIDFDGTVGKPNVSMVDDNSVVDDAVRIWIVVNQFQLILKSNVSSSVVVVVVLIFGLFMYIYFGE